MHSLYAFLRAVTPLREGNYTSSPFSLSLAFRNRMGIVCPQSWRKGKKWKQG